jgi:hypothetical protein
MQIQIVVFGKDAGYMYPAMFPGLYIASLSNAEAENAWSLSYTTIVLVKQVKMQFYGGSHCIVSLLT